MGCNYEHKGPKDRRKVSFPVKVARYVLNFFFAGPFTVPVSFNQQKWKYKQIEIVKNFADEVYSSLHFEGNSLKAQLLELDFLLFMPFDIGFPVYNLCTILFGQFSRRNLLFAAGALAKSQWPLLKHDVTGRVDQLKMVRVSPPASPPSVDTD